ncbi:MAG: hypothetical protein PHE32_03845 [Candidatus Shapirobacteria bacterium]|nr:hypothetical protein [Candidatus Shapirobacteria bacterium]MDD4410808.1 hypothetical protein [Candidatus Shapirobacteria bacterium]
MKKIFMSILAIALTIGAVSGTAYALFSDTVDVAGITMTSGNANLEIYDSGTNQTKKIATWITESLNPSGKLSNLYPGFKDYTKMDFKNESASAIGLDLKAQLTSAGGDWGYLKDKIYMTIKDTYTIGSFPTEGWYTLEQLNSSPRAFGITLAHKEVKTYYVFVKILDSVGNEIAGKSLSNVSFVFTGTQAN